MHLHDANAFPGVGFSQEVVVVLSRALRYGLIFFCSSAISFEVAVGAIRLKMFEFYLLGFCGVAISVIAGLVCIVIGIVSTLRRH